MSSLMSQCVKAAAVRVVQQVACFLLLPSGVTGRELRCYLEEQFSTSQVAQPRHRGI